jgi:flagellar transcriptional activator FlhD
MSKVVSDTLNEIQAVNLAYLSVVQRILRDDKKLGMCRLGISEPIADTLLKLSIAQMASLSRSTHLLLRFKFDDKAVLSALAGTSRAMNRDASIGQAVEES